MARPKVKLKLKEDQVAELERLWQTQKDPRAISRLLVIRAALSGNNTYDEIAALVGCSRMTVARHLRHFNLGGFDQLLKRGRPKPPKTPLNDGTIRQAFGEAVRTRSIKTAREAQVWLKQEYGIDRSVWALYYWLKKVR